MNTGIAAALTAAVLSAALGCGDGPGSSGPTTPSSSSSFPQGTLILTASPIDQAAIRWITPLGNLNPPQHTLPTDHIYFYFANPDAGESAVARRTTVFAPGAGTVTFVIGGAAGQESKLFVRQTATHLKYYAEPVRAQLYARVQRLGTDLDGTINYDVAARLSGNWFSTVDAAPVSFAYDTWDPSRVLISIGSGNLPGVFAIAAGDPAPRDISVSTGVVLYTLTRARNGPGGATGGATTWMLVQMTDDTHLRLERFTSRPEGFSAITRTFSR